MRLFTEQSVLVIKLIPEIHILKAGGQEKHFSVDLRKRFKFSSGKAEQLSEVNIERNDFQQRTLFNHVTESTVPIWGLHIKSP